MHGKISEKLFNLAKQREREREQMRREPRKSYNEQIIYSIPVWFVRFKIDWNDQFTSIIMFFSSFVSNRLQSLDLLRVCCNAVRASERTHDPSNEWAKKLNTSRATVLRAHNVINAYVHLLIFILSSDTHPFYCTALHWAFDGFARCLFFFHSASVETKQRQRQQKQ